MSALGAERPLKLAALALLGALLAFQLVRSAAVADRDKRPELAAALWPSHPAVLTDRALLDVASAAARGDGVPPTTRAHVRSLAAKAPLSPDPFLIEGAVAQSEGRDEDAEKLLLAARARDPRSRGARFLLAERFLRSGRITEGLIEMRALVQLQSRGVEVFGPALIAYARSPGAVPQLRGFFRKYPGSEAGILSALALDPANADLVLSLATSDRRPDPDWRGTLVNSLAAAGQFERAHAIWARLSRVRGGPVLFNPSFAEVDAPPPFNWHFPPGSEGVAEPDGKGGLDVLYYGRADVVLASQLMVLPAGRYRLSADIDGAGNEAAIRWAFRCAQGQKVIAQLPLRAGPVAGSFAIPNDCPAQWLELRGAAKESPVTTELTIRRLRLVREAGK